MSRLPSGTVTFLFTDVEGSTRLLHELGDGYAEVLAEHRRVLREAFARHGGVEVDTQGDAFFVAFAKASDALSAAREARDVLAAGPIRVRMGVHTGEPIVTDEGYVGIDVHRAARIAAAGHGGQILLSQSTRDLAGENGLRDLGEHRLKDFATPERIYQLGDGDFPPLKSLNNSNLPLPAEPLIGRKKELADVLRMLRDSVRLVTVTGPGGTGKTRFALETASELIDHFRDGVWWVGLAPVRDARLVVPTIAAAIGTKDDLAVELRGKELLLLLDNFEHVVTAARDIADIQRSCPAVAAIVTSREPLHVAGEREFPLAPLAEAPAVELFRQRAEAVAPGYEADYAALVEVCQRLDCLPLAIELAAARTKTLSTTDLHERLEERLSLLSSRRRDVDERQRTLRATIEWSYELLESEEQRVFGRLSIFLGSFDQAAAEAICDADIDMLESLLDKSLLRRTDDDRFFMLETIREFAAGVVPEEESDDLRLRHSKFFATLSDEFADAMSEHLHADVLRSLDRERENFRRALVFSYELREYERLAQIAANVVSRWIWTQRDDATVWLERALEHVPQERDELRPRLEARLGDVAFARADWDECERLHTRALTAFREAGDSRREAGSLMRLTHSAAMRKDFAVARRRAAEAARAASAAGYERGETIAESDLGSIALYEGDYARARDHLQRAAPRFLESGDDGDAGLALLSLAEAELLAGEPLQAANTLKQALPLLLSAADGFALAHALEALAAVLVAQARPVEAVIVVASSARLRRELGVELQPLERDLHVRTAASLEAAGLQAPHETALPPDIAIQQGLAALD